MDAPPTTKRNKKIDWLDGSPKDRWFGVFGHGGGFFFPTVPEKAYVSDLAVGRHSEEVTVGRPVHPPTFSVIVTRSASASMMMCVCVCVEKQLFPRLLLL